MIKRLGIFGGAFDPVHKGHTQSLKFINDLKIVDEVHVIPNFASPHDKNIQSSGSHRLKMLEMAFNEFEKIKINEIELQSLIHIRRCRRRGKCRSLWSPYH